MRKLDKHEATAESRKLVKALASYGTVPECIAMVLGCKVEEVRRNYEEELAKAEIEATAKVAAALYKRALNGDNQAAIFILKSRAGWREK